MTASDGLHVFDVTSHRQVAFVPGLGLPAVRGGVARRDVSVRD